MQTNNLKYLKFVRFKEVEQWDLKRYYSNMFKSKFSACHLTKVIKEESQKYDISDPKCNYGILGVNNQTGIFDAYTENGSKINQKYKKMQTGWIAYNPYRVNVGSIGIKDGILQNEYISPAYVVFSCKETLLPYYLFLTMKTDVFNKIIRDNTTGSVRQNLSFEILKNLQIPLPTLTEQQALVSAYNAKIAEAEAKEAEAEKKSKEIEEYLLSELGIQTSEEKAEKTKEYMKFVRFKEVEEWGVDKIRGINKKLLSSQKYHNHKLRDILEINPTTSFNELKDGDEISFIPMECISDEYGMWKEKRTCKKQDSKGYTKFAEGDIIWARITPCMQNGKSAIVTGLINGKGCGSTEFHVLRNMNKNLNMTYVHKILRLPMVLEDAKKSFTGSAGQQRVPKSYLEQLSIPLPPLEIQNAIVAHISEQKEQIKQLKQEAKELRESALKEFENEIFG